MGELPNQPFEVQAMIRAKDHYFGTFLLPSRLDDLRLLLQLCFEPVPQLTSLPWWEGTKGRETQKLRYIGHLFQPPPLPPPSRGEGVLALSDTLRWGVILCSNSRLVFFWRGGLSRVLLEDVRKGLPEIGFSSSGPPRGSDSRV